MGGHSWAPIMAVQSPRVTVLIFPEPPSFLELEPIPRARRNPNPRPHDPRYQITPPPSRSARSLDYEFKPMAAEGKFGGEIGDPQKLAPDLKDESSPSSSATNPSSNGQRSSELVPAPEKRRRTEASPDEAKAPPPEDSRRMFQRLWTDDDEIAILQGFLDFTSSQRSSHDTGAFYDQIRASIRLDFSKSQLVEKLRRLKKKYRNVASRIRSGKDFAFKSAHEQAAFDLSSKIWGAGDEEEEEEERKRPAAVAAAPLAAAPPPSPAPAGKAVEETMRSCLSPMLKELVRFASPGLSGLGIGLSPLPFGIGDGGAGKPPNAAAEERLRRQQILELEVFSRRIDLVQEQIKVVLAELRSRR